MSTPMMQQWRQCKEKAKGALLFFRLGDFYEAFHQDAEIISQELHLTLTKRQEVPMCGVPAHALDTYLDKLIEKGFRLAIAEQTEDPKLVKGLVKREIIRIVSPGTIISSGLLKEKKNNFFISLEQVGQTFGLAIIDLTTSEFKVLELENKQQLLDEIYRLRPSEILVSEKFKSQREELIKELSCTFPFVLNIAPNYHFDPPSALEALLQHFQVKSLDGFGLKDKIASIIVAGALLTYLSKELNLDLTPFTHLQKESLADYMSLDRSTLQHLEIGALFKLLDKTRTSMGGRLLTHWIHHPLLSLIAIQDRQQAISELLPHLFSMQSYLTPIRDLERLTIRLARKVASPRDLGALCLSLQACIKVKELLQPLQKKLWQEHREAIFDLTSITQKILGALKDTLPPRLSDGDIFKEGYHQELDNLKILSRNSKEWLASYQGHLREEYGIRTLKVGFTQAFGYYIEISRGQSEKAPPHFERKQTLVSSERFITKELQEFEQKILTAEEKIQRLEKELFFSLCDELLYFSSEISKTAVAIAHIDALFSLAQTAVEHRYTCPTLHEGYDLVIEKGRHPLIEKSLIEFIANDTYLSFQENLYLITGPNMAGKSTYIRQVALIAILAQIGSFVPAKSATIGIIDQVFSRIGASDDLTRGKSTFMVEMSETANILHNATDRSLVILDEIGRGTSTYDGISIAWAVAEYLLTKLRTKTLFATHYWELTKLEEKIPGAINYRIGVQESESDIIFLHKILKGGTDKSYGIHVAKLAGLPLTVIHRAKEMLASLEKERGKTPPLRHEQVPLFKPPYYPILERLQQKDLEHTTPIEALQILIELQKSL